MATLAEYGSSEGATGENASAHSKQKSRMFTGVQVDSVHDTNMHVYIYMYIYEYTYIYVYAYVCTLAYTPIYIYITIPRSRIK